MEQDHRGHNDDPPRFPPCPDGPAHRVDRITTSTVTPSFSAALSFVPAVGTLAVEALDLQRAHSSMRS